MSERTDNTDYGITPLLFPVPVTALQIFCKDHKWRFVDYNTRCPRCQSSEKRSRPSLTVTSRPRCTRSPTPLKTSSTFNGRPLFLFSMAPRADLRLRTVVESPLLQREGLIIEQGVFRDLKKLTDAGVPVPTSKEWRGAQIGTRNQVGPKGRLGGVKEINGVKFGEDTFSRGQGDVASVVLALDQSPLLRCAYISK